MSGGGLFGYEKESLENVLNGLKLLVDFKYQFNNHKKVIIK